MIYQGHNSYGNRNCNFYTYGQYFWVPHFHKNIEWIYALRGNTVITVNDAEKTLQPGECALILPNQIHSVKSCRDSLVWIAVFSEDFVSEFSSFMKNKQGSEISFFPDEEAVPVFRSVMMGRPGEFLLKSAFYLICDQYLKHVAVEPKGKSNEAMICRILDYVTEHYAEDVSLHRVAELFGYEYHYLSRILNRDYKIRFKDFLNEYRVSRAVDLLDQGKGSVTDVALECGFQSIRNFNHVFKSVTGKTPGEYRKNTVSEIKL